MSDVVAVVRFGDGEVHIAWYATDPEYVVPLLFDPADAERVAAAARGPELAELAELAAAAPQPVDDEPVEVWIPDHDRWWPGRASRSAALLTEGSGPFALDDPEGPERPTRREGAPSWAGAWDPGVPAPVDPAIPLAHPSAVVPPPAATVGPPTAIPPALTADADLLATASMLLSGALDGLALDRFVEGALRRAGDDPADLAVRLASILDRATSSTRSWDYLGSFVGAVILELVGRPRNDDHLQFGRPIARRPNPYFLLEPRGSEVVERLRARRPGPLLSMPTEPSGAIDPTVLASRLAEAESLGLVADGLVAADLAVASIRAGIDDVAWPELPDWDDPRTWRGLPRASATMGFAVLSQREMGMASTHTLHLAAFPSIWPHQPERAVARLAELFRLDVDRGPSATPSTIAALCRWFATEGVAIGPGAGAVAALGLGAKLDEVTAAARTLLVAGRDQDGWRSTWVPSAIVQAVTAGHVKVRRLVDGLRPLIDDDPGLVRDVTFSTLPALLEAGHRDAHLLLALAADAPGPSPVPIAVVELAAAKGSTKAHREARRLVAASADGPPADG